MPEDRNRQKKDYLHLALARPSHAYLFVGGESDKHEIVIDFARKMVGDISAGDYSRWIYEVAPLDDKKIGIGQVKELSNFANQSKSKDVENKLIVINRAELLSIEAANALLLLLEEPPDNTIFILVASSVERLPATIISRTQVIRLRDGEKLNNNDIERANAYLQADLVGRLTVASQNNDKVKAEELIAGISKVLIGDDSNSAIRRGESLLLAQSHLYNNGNPKFVLECLALEFE